MAPNPKPNYLSGPNFNKPVTVSIPKSKPRLKPKPAKVGPYTKPISYKHWVRKGKPAGQPVKLDSGEVVVAKPRRQPAQRPSRPSGPRAINVPKGQKTVPLPEKPGDRGVIPYGKTTPSVLTAKERHQIQKAAWLDPFPTGQQMTRAYQDITNIPAGTYELGKAVSLDNWDAAHGDFSFKRSRKLGVGMYKGFVHSLHHPSEDPFGTALNISALALPAARIGEVSEAMTLAGRAGGARAALGAAARTAVNRGPQATASRTLKLGDFETPALTSRSSSWRYVQRVHDTMVRKAAEAMPGSPAYNYWVRRIGREQRKNRIVDEAIDRAPAIALGRHHLTAPMQAALRSYAENTPAELRQLFHQRIEKRSMTAAGRHKVHEVVNRLSSKYLAIDEHGNVQFAATRQGQKLSRIYQEMEHAANNREQLMKDLGFTPTEARIHGPGQIIRGITGQSNITVPGPTIEHWPQGTVFHGSPEGAIKAGAIDPLHHTKPWQEGVGFYVTSSKAKALGYAAGRTARGERYAGAAEKGAVTPFRLATGAKTIDMTSKANLPLWRRIAQDLGFDKNDFDQYILKQAGEKPTNGRIREEVLYQLEDTSGSEAIYHLEEA